MTKQADVKASKVKEDAYEKQVAKDKKEVKDAEKAVEKEVKDTEKNEAKELKTSQDADSKAQEEAKKESKTSGKVYAANGSFVREYTEEHSDDDKTYLEKAKGYAQKIGGSVK